MSPVLHVGAPQRRAVRVLEVRLVGEVQPNGYESAAVGVDRPPPVFRPLERGIARRLKPPILAAAAGIEPLHATASFPLTLLSKVRDSRRHLVEELLANARPFFRIVVGVELDGDPTVVPDVV